MSMAQTRSSLAAAIDSVDGLTGYLQMPTAPKDGDGWPMWTEAEDTGTMGGTAYIHTWAVWVVVPNDPIASDTYVDSILIPLSDALSPEMAIESVVSNLAPDPVGRSIIITGKSE